MAGPAAQTLPKDYSIMALLVPHKPTLAGLIPFPFGFHASARPIYLLSFPPFFLSGKKMRRAGRVNKSQTIKTTTS